MKDILHLNSLFLAFAFGVIGFSVGLNAMIKSNQEESTFQRGLPPGTQVTVNIDDILYPGVVVTAVCAIIAVLTAIFIPLHILSPPFASHTKQRLEPFLLAFFALVLFITLVPFTIYVAQHRANVTASLFGIELPRAVILEAEKLLGATSIYRDIAYLRFLAIFPWFTVLFTGIAAAISFTVSQPISPPRNHVAKIKKGL